MRILISLTLLIALVFLVSAPAFSADAGGLMKSGLIGAATGAVASGASGGKAGKGALIGAGTGIAAGAIADVLMPSEKSQPAPAASSTADESGGFERGYNKGYEAGYQTGYQAGIKAPR